MQPEPFKSCGCGRSYTREQWEQLKIVGLGEGESDARPLSYRQCRCGSTLAVVVESDADWARDELMACLGGGIFEHLKDNREAGDL